MPQVVSRPRSVMLYGASGSTKTTQLYFLARYIHRLTGKKIRMIHGDPGGYAPFVDSGMIDRGEVEVFDFSFREKALADIRRLSEGYWPRYTTDGKEYFKTCEDCSTTNEEWQGIAGYFIESMTSIGELLKTHCSNQTEGVGFKESWKYEEDGYTITGLQPGHYDLIQKEIYSRHTQGFNSLPIQYLVWTALVGKGEDKQNRETVYGPQIVGNATTARVPTWFMECLHLSKEVIKDDKTGQVSDRMVAWFTQHRDGQTEVPYLCKPRIAPELYPKLIEYFPYGFVPLGFKAGIDKYFMVMDRLRKELQDDKETSS